MTVDAIRKAAPHALVAALVTAAGVLAVIVINVGLLDYASDPVGNLSPRTAVAGPKAKQHAVRPARRQQVRHPIRAKKAAKRVTRARPVVQASAPAPVANAAPAPAQSPVSTVQPKATVHPAAPKAKTIPAPKPTTREPPLTTTQHREREHEHEDD
jgi:hypothetical protein